MNTHQEAKKYSHGKGESKESNNKMNFGQKETVGGTDMSNITCYNCCEQGHYTRSCHNKKEKSNKHIHSNTEKVGGMKMMMMLSTLMTRQMNLKSVTSG